MISATSIAKSALCVLAITAVLANGATAQTSGAPKSGTPNIDPNNGWPLREVPVLDRELNFVPQLAARPIPAVDAPALFIRVKETTEAETADLVIVVKEPTEIATPDLVIVVSEPTQVETPDLVIVVKEPTLVEIPDLVIVVEDDNNESDPTGSGAPVIVGSEFTSQGDIPDNPAARQASSDEVVAPRICVGEYTLHSASAVGSGYGAPKMPVGTPVLANAVLTTDSCGAFLTMKSQGQSILLARQHGEENVYVGKLTLPDGVDRTLRLVCGRGLNMWGVLYAEDESLKIRRPMWLRHASSSTATLATCVK